MYPRSITLLFLSSFLASSLARHLPRDHRNRAAYFQDNEPAGSSIVALQISKEDGSLSSPVKTSTGGKGDASLIAVSQHSVIVEQDYLFTVNQGDSTVSMFIIDPEDPLHPKLVGTPASTSGNIPVAVTYSAALKTACVANGGPNAGVSCFSVDDRKGLIPVGGLRSVPHPTDNVPPFGLPPFILIADIVFNPSSSALFATARSNGLAPGYIYAWPVVDGKVAEKAVASSFQGVAFDFSLNFIGSDSRLFLTNPLPGTDGAAYLKVEYPSLSIKEEKSIKIPEQFAACWVAYAPEFRSIYVIDAGRPNVTIVDPETGNVKGSFSFPVPAGSGPISGGLDAAVDRKRLYMITDSQVAPQIEVFDLAGRRDGGSPSLVQSFDIFSQVGKLTQWTGMATYPQDY